MQSLLSLFQYQIRLTCVTASLSSEFSENKAIEVYTYIQIMCFDIIKRVTREGISKDSQTFRNIEKCLNFLHILHILQICHILPIFFWQKERFQPRVYLLYCANTAQISALKNTWPGNAVFRETRLKPIQAVHLCISEEFVRIGYFKDCSKLLP